MQKLQFVVAGLFLLWLLPQVACERPENDSMTSQHGDNDSHYNGRICGDCHYSAGPGEGWFTMAGTATGNYQQAVIEIYPAPNGQGGLMVRAEVDAKGNFYTTDAMPKVLDGIWPLIHHGNGSSESHPVEIFTGQCNMCHGAQEGPIHIESN